jgi:hypothetical protein
MYSTTRRLLLLPALAATAALALAACSGESTGPATQPPMSQNDANAASDVIVGDLSDQADGATTTSSGASLSLIAAPSSGPSQSVTALAKAPWYSTACSPAPTVTTNGKHHHLCVRPLRNLAAHSARDAEPDGRSRRDAGSWQPACCVQRLPAYLGTDLFPDRANHHNFGHAGRHSQHHRRRYHPRVPCVRLERSRDEPVPDRLRARGSVHLAARTELAFAVHGGLSPARSP